MTRFAHTEKATLTMARTMAATSAPAHRDWAKIFPASTLYWYRWSPVILPSSLLSCHRANHGKTLNRVRTTRIGSIPVFSGNLYVVAIFSSSLVRLKCSTFFASIRSKCESTETFICSSMPLNLDAVPHKKDIARSNITDLRHVEPISPTILSRFVTNRPNVAPVPVRHHPTNLSICGALSRIPFKEMRKSWCSVLATSLLASISSPL